MAKVTIYSTPTCPYCKMAKEFFKSKNVEFSDIDVAANSEEAQKMIEKSGQTGVPVIIIDDNGKEDVIVGFNQEKIESLLGL